MPAEVPPSCQEFFGLASWSCHHHGCLGDSGLVGINVNQFVQAIFSPLAVGLNTLPGMLLYTLILLLWCLGIHGSNVMGSIDPIFLALLAANTEAYTAGEPLPTFLQAGFISCFVLWRHWFNTGADHQHVSFKKKPIVP